MTDFPSPFDRPTRPGPSGNGPTSNGPAGSGPTGPARGSAVKRFFKSPLFILFMALVVIGGVVAFSINRIMLTVLHSRAEVVVPKLEGRSLMEALSIVSPLDLSIQQEGTDYDESLPAGTIIRQQPPSGMRVRAGRSLRVVVSKGGQVVFVPVIIGKPLVEAQSILTSAGLQMGSVNEVFSSDTAKGMVITQNPSSGTIVTRGALIDVEASKGLAPDGVPTVPNFIGKTADIARDWVKSSNAELDVSEDKTNTGLPGTIVRQEPLPGQPLLEGQHLMITIVPSASADQQDRITYQVPADQGDVVVRIMARDTRGENKIYEAKHPAGAAISVPVTVTSPTRFRIYVNDILKDERVIEPLVKQ